MLRRDRPSIAPANMREGRKRDAIVTVTMVGFLNSVIKSGKRSAEF
jgi:hypothetical protein